VKENKETRREGNKREKIGDRARRERRRERGESNGEGMKQRGEGNTREKGTGMIGNTAGYRRMKE
jgi:hypothetical protein